MPNNPFIKNKKTHPWFITCYSEVRDLNQTSAECNYIDYKWDYSQELFICKFSVELEGHTLKRATTSFKKQGRTDYLCFCCLCKETVNAFLGWHKLSCADVSQSHKLLSLFKCQVVCSWMRSVPLATTDKIDSTALKWEGPAQSAQHSSSGQLKDICRGKITLLHTCLTLPSIAQ